MIFVAGCSLAQDPTGLAIWAFVQKAWHHIAGIHNTFRALVVHPLHASDPLTGDMVAWLGERQTRRGDWGHEIPFFQALNALAHLDGFGVDGQLEKAFSLLYRTQRPDGTWGGPQAEWHAFLAVHALRNKGLSSIQHPINERPRS